MGIEINTNVAFRAAARRFKQDTMKVLKKAGRVVVLDCTERIRSAVDLKGKAQKQNTGPVKRRKFKRLGHFVPLRDTDKLMDADLWRVRKIAGRPAVTVYPPIIRVKIIGYLEQKGYRPPLGISPTAAEIIAEMIDTDVMGALQREW